MVRKSTAEKNNYICPACGDELRRDPAGRGFVRHVSNPNCFFERRQKDADPVPTSQGATSASPPKCPAAGSSGVGVVRQHLRDWALGAGIALDSSDYTLRLDDNLFTPLSDASRRDFAQGDGAELGAPGTRGKMQALHSSSALACNVFEYWRGREASALADGLGLQDEIASIRFEQKFPTGLPGNPPNLDVVLQLADDSIVAVESKFLEPYGGRHTGFKPKYFESSPGHWKRSGYPHCQELAEALSRGEASFRWLHAEQLFRHILGLAKSGRPWELLYLWYQVPGPAGTEHASEASAFADAVSADPLRFRSMTYQELFSSLRGSGERRNDAYLAYLEERYFL